MDLGDPEVWSTRSWHWLRDRVIGLLATDTRIARALTPAAPDRK